jgi:hypothetical protein
MYVSTMIVTVRIVIADLMEQWRPYVRTHDGGYVHMASTVPLSQQCQYELSQSSWVRTYGLHCPIKAAMTILTVTIIVGTYIWPPLSH